MWAACQARRSSGQDSIRDPSLFEKVINKLTLAGILELPRFKVRLRDDSVELRTAFGEMT